MYLLLKYCNLRTRTTKKIMAAITGKKNLTFNFASELEIYVRKIKVKLLKKNKK